ncbi:MAG: ADP-glyceromanno-heptose 6-epimerase [Deltaproteobacteria bacterium]|nr:ADP-glyceromanno-heptose 6-epimerase [Deltaproteobacteria bacterium]MBW2594628.1 ADP-glyceromanno-heptose 6-epimerase [Deltaproteobacteria bacterium]MBW2651128.1 ADP-glyceromanno-heptose 6-epimerase [Deltaproteobacteria bacterium]
MIVVTGGAGFIGSAVVWKLNTQGFDDIVIVDSLEVSEKWKNLVNRRFVDYLDKDDFLELVLDDEVPFEVEAIVHMGACSSTTERDADYLIENNYHYTARLAEWAVEKNIHFIYASSAATYGDGSAGFSDDDGVSAELRPINMYGYSKQLFDQWVLRKRLEEKTVGIKFFNVFGPNEYHKGEMRSVIHKSFGQIRETGKVRLFKSHRPDFRDGEQKRDFIYVKDCAEVIWWFLENRDVAGIFNLGTGRARTWNDLTRAVFAAMGIEPRIEYIEMPESIRQQYQYFTEAKMDKLLSAGCSVPTSSLENAVSDYVVNYLEKDERYL